MGDPGVYLEKISAFSRMLQIEGLCVSPQETADACKILISFGLCDREQVKTAIRTVYAKSREEQAVFDRVFDGFFVSEEVMRQQAQKHMEEERQMQEMRREAEDDLRVNGEPMDLSQEQRDIYAAMSQMQKQRLKNFMEKYKDSAARNPKLYSNFIHSVFARAIMEQQMMMEDAGVGREEVDPELGLLYRDISLFKEAEIPKAIAMIQEVTRQINGQLSAKRKHRGHTGILDFRRTIRKGLETGGSLNSLRFKRKRQRRKHLVLLCDVSGSMIQFSEFALRFIQSLNQVSESSRTFLFSEDIYEANIFSLQNMDRFRTYVKESGLYGRGTDVGAALRKLCEFNPSVLSPSTTLLILSDTKTVDLPGAAQALLEAKRLSGRLIWMNPIPENMWPYIRSVQMISSICTMISCSTLHALASACRRLILS